MGQVCGVGRGLRWKIKQNKSKFLALSMLGSKLFDIPSYEQSLSIVHDLELWASDMIFFCNTSSCHDIHLYHINYKSQHKWPSYGQTRTGFTEIYAQSLRADCATDLWPTDMEHWFVIMIICTKLFSNPTMHDKVMVLTWTSFIEAYAQSLNANCDLDL